MKDDLSPELVQQVARLLQESQKAKASPPKTVRELWKEWEPTTLKRKDSRVIQTVKPLLLDTWISVEGMACRLGDLQWTDCNVAAVEAWQAKAATIPRRRRNREDPHASLSASYRNRALGPLQRMFTDHVRWGNIPRNPMSGWEREDDSDGIREGWLTEEECQRFMSHAHPLLARMFRLSYRCGGLRNSEVRLLKKTNVNWEARLLVIRASEHKNRKRKMIPIPPSEFEMLEAQRMVAPGEFLFPNPKDPKGGPVPGGTLQGWMEKAREDSGIRAGGERVVFHTGRHNFGMHTVLKGVPLNHIADVMGCTVQNVARYSKLAGEAIEILREMMEKPLQLPTRTAPARSNHPENKEQSGVPPKD